MTVHAITQTKVISLRVDWLQRGSMRPLCWAVNPGAVAVANLPGFSNR